MRKSKTLAQQARYYECADEYEMMDVMYASFVNGNFSDFKRYYRALRNEDRRRFIHYLHDQADGHTFYEMVDTLMFN